MQITAKVDGAPAENVFQGINKRISNAQAASKMFLGAYKMTGINSFLISANRESVKSIYMLNLINKNLNLYYIVTKGYGLN